jgi:hypothetical protein
MVDERETNPKALSGRVKTLSDNLKPWAELFVSLGILCGPPTLVVTYLIGYGPVAFAIVPVVFAIAVTIVGVIVFAVLSFWLELKWLSVVESLLKQESVVASVFVFDGDQVLLVEDEENDPPWLVPPSTRIRCFTAHKGGPDKAIIRQVKSESGIGIQIDRPGGGTKAVTPIAVPFFAQSERQFSWLGRKTYHDFYYLGHLVDDQRKILNPNRGYKWIDAKNLDHSPSTATPDDMKTLIHLALKQRRRQSRVSL